MFLYRPKGSPKGTPSRTVTLGLSDDAVKMHACCEALKLAGKAASGGDPAAHIRPERRRSRSRLSAASSPMSASCCGARWWRGRRRCQACGAASLTLDDEVGAIEQPQLIARISAIATHPRRHKDGTGLIGRRCGGGVQEARPRFPRLVR